jgi:nicotinamidase/pyrazinamidase
VRVLTDLVAGVAPDSSAAAIAELAHAGVSITTSETVRKAQPASPAG